MDVAERLGLHTATAPAPSERPRVLLNMVSTLDGRATLSGRSGAIGNRADRELFHALRSVVDAVMVGAGTARAERYGRLVREESARERRRARGLAAEPLACIVSGRLSLSGEIPLLADPAARVAVLTASAAGVLDCEAHIEYIRAVREGRLDLPGALAELSGRFAVRSVLCEGGPPPRRAAARGGIGGRAVPLPRPAARGRRAPRGRRCASSRGSTWTLPWSSSC